MADNDGIAVLDSGIHGKGVFAIRRFQPGETVVKWDMSHPLTDAELKALPEHDLAYVTRCSGTFILMQPPAKFVNHSCDPNTRATDDGRDVAIREIQPGDEITSDYHGQGFSGKRMTCRCGSQNCRGTFVN